MGDVVFVSTVIVFFALALAYVRGCERITGGDEVVRATGAAGDPVALEATGDEREAIDR